MTEPRFGKVKYATIRRDFDELRSAIRKHNSFATEAAWEKCERWMEAISPAALQAFDEREDEDALNSKPQDARPGQKRFGHD
ncbi:hypothetical protein WNY61_03475 [Sulfitobacter sp. AS92]|uniref:hypothetical protein n=1 Tax=Sulfitobacter sp. AS92 TaxID=3135783 RepID=UPI003171FBED